MVKKEAYLILIQPLFHKDNRKRSPLHLMSMGTKANKIVSTKVIDGQTLSLSTNKLADLVISYNPKIVGISILSPTYPSSLKLIKAIKKRLPNAIYIAGGKHATIESQNILKTGIFDLLIRGEGDLILADIVKQYLLSGENLSSLQKKFNNYPGIYFPNSKHPIALIPRVNLKNLSKINWKILVPTLNSYLGNTFSVEDQRGCIHNCSYCSASKFYQYVTFRDPVQITNDIFEMYKLGFTSFFLTGDDSFINPDSSFQMLNNIASKKISIKLFLNTRADSFIRCFSIYGNKFAKALVEAHVDTLHIGVESGDKNILKLCNKRLNLKDVSKTISIANKLGIIVETNWIIGLPDDSEKSIKKSLKLATKISHKSGPHFPHISYFMPYPGTKDTETAKEYGLFNPANFKLSTLTAHDKPLIPTKYLTKIEITNLFNNFVSTFYNEKYIRSLSPKDLKNKAIFMKNKLLQIN